MKYAVDGELDIVGNDEWERLGATLAAVEAFEPLYARFAEIANLTGNSVEVTIVAALREWMQDNEEMLAGLEAQFQPDKVN